MKKNQTSKTLRIQYDIIIKNEILIKLRNLKGYI